MFNRKACGMFVVGTLALGAGSAMASELLDYASVQVASQTVSPGNGLSDLTNMALVVTGGKSMEEIQPGLAIEGELTKSFSTPAKTYSGIDYDAEVLTLSGYAVYKLAMTSQANLRLKGGLRYGSVTSHASAAGYSASETDTETGAAFGVGATYAFNKDSDLQAEYTAISSDVTHLSAGVQFRF